MLGGEVERERHHHQGRRGRSRSCRRSNGGSVNYCGFAPGSLVAPPISIMRVEKCEIYCGSGVFIVYDPSFGGANQYTFWAGSVSGTGSIAGTFEISTQAMIDGQASGVYEAQNIIIEMDFPYGGGGGTPYIDSPPPDYPNQFYGVRSRMQMKASALVQFATTSALGQRLRMVMKGSRLVFDRVRYSKVFV